jgi:hypothetical protein
MAKTDETLVWLVAGAAAIGLYFYAQSQGTAAGTAASGPTATPLSIYPEYSYLAQPTTSSMASTPQQQATAQVIPIPQWVAVQGQEQAQILGQCAGSYPGCTVLVGDTQLGF